MPVSLSNIPKNSQVYRFITSGKRGRCSLCSHSVEKLEAHHVCYSPEITLNLCHNCHHKVHFWPQRLNDSEKLKLLSKRFSPNQAQEIINKKMLGFSALAKLIAPSRNAFIHASQRAEKKNHPHIHPKAKIDMRGFNKGRAGKNYPKSSYSKKIIKVNK